VDLLIGVGCFVENAVVWILRFSFNGFQFDSSLLTLIRNFCILELIGKFCISRIDGNINRAAVSFIFHIRIIFVIFFTGCLCFLNVIDYVQIENHTFFDLRFALDYLLLLLKICKAGLKYLMNNIQNVLDLEESFECFLLIAFFV
jgi:hypothetical protein